MPPPHQSAIERQRTRQFLVAHTAIVAAAGGLVLGAGFAGFAAGALFFEGIITCILFGALTAAGWSVWRAGLLNTALVLGLLYIDSALGLLFLYISGEFESPALALVLLAVATAPVFVERRHAYGLASFQAALYTSLLLIRQHELLPEALPYGYVLPQASVTHPSFVLDAWLSFMILAIGVALLAGRASADILNSRAQLEREVALKTRPLKAARDELAARNDDLGAANQALVRSRDTLAAAVGHDLRAPLQTVISSAEAVRALGPVNDRQRAQLRKIVRTTGRMAEQLARLLHLSRLSHQLTDMAPVPIGEALQRVREDLGTHLAARRVQLEVVHPLPDAMGDQALLREVIQNLLENGVKYGDAQTPRVRVESADAPEGRVAFAIEDNGAGVDSAKGEKIFDLFYQSDSEAVGVGAGLAIVQRIVSAHGGAVRVERGRTLSGARFIVELDASSHAPARDGDPLLH